jgi:UMF1 family MFS transporter
MAVQTVMLAAVFFAEHELPWESNSQKSIGLIVCTLLIQLVAILGAYLLSFVSKKIGNIKALGVTIVIWIMVCIYAFFVQTPNQFYIAAAFVGLVMGGIQSLSRSTYSKLLPETNDTASFFSFYDVAEKVGIVIGMFMYGFVGAITGSMRYAVLFLVLFFILGLIQLFRIPKDETGIVI